MCCMKEKHLLRYRTLTYGMAGLLDGLRHVLNEKGDGKIKCLAEWFTEYRHVSKSNE